MQIESGTGNGRVVGVSAETDFLFKQWMLALNIMQIIITEGHITPCSHKLLLAQMIAFFI